MPNHPKIEDEVLFATTKSILRKAQMFFYLQTVLTALCWIALIAAFSIKFIGGYSNLVIPLALIGGVCGFGGWIVGQIANPYYSDADKIRKSLADIANENGKNNKNTESTKIPLTIGFANLSGVDLDAIASEDAAALSQLFARSSVVANHQIPNAEILFVYAHLNEDGTIKGPTSSGIRQIVQLTNAAILILASPNSSDSIQKAFALPGPKTANIVFTLDRNGSGFSCFFQALFEKMRDGKDMLSAWVELAPQAPNANIPNTPQTLLFAEAGKIAFPH
ncbi:MAG: hypothetical protein Q7U57_20295 [Methylovulum sp.]|nr:hypothetical protein [Methylovulum sp.]